ncbi:hypothetical protein ACFY3U_17605 [Micromonospora sp. NPDC000089]|uniref:LppU/SCO3897 family protein n=1 Tax=unclassified Micromonospora TaxID=2617518 RepID=UPI00367C347A
MSEQVAPPPAPQPGPPAAPQPGPSFGPLPGSPVPPAPAVQAPPPAQPQGKSAGRKALGIVGAVVAFLVVAALKFGVGAAIGSFFNKDETAEAKAGDCIAELPEIKGTEAQSVDDAKVVTCTSTDAAYNVVGRVDGQTEAQAKSGEACNQYIKEGEDGYVFYSISDGGKGYLLCLTKKG